MNKWQELSKTDPEAHRRASAKGGRVTAAKRKEKKQLKEIWAERKARKEADSLEQKLEEENHGGDPIT